MSTEINIRKRIDIQEEGVSITPDVNSINFIGAGVTASTAGDNVTVNVQGSIGATAYYLNESVSQAPYAEFSSVATAAPESDVLTSIAPGITSYIGEYQTPVGVPNTTVIPAGLWQFFLHNYSGNPTDSWDLFVEVYSRDTLGTETLLFTTDAVSIPAMPTTPTMYITDGVFPTTTLITTDRIVVKVAATNTGAGAQIIHMVTEGSAHYSVATTTLNQVIGAGAVTSVTGTAPVVSSGGTTPAISMAQANGSTDGYLDSADWTTFNNKVDDNIYTADGTVVGTRTVDLDGNTINFNDGKVGVNVTPNFTLQVRGTAVPSAGETIARFDVTDSSAYLSVVNGTATNGVFAPMIQGRQIGTSIQPALSTEGIIDVADDTGTAAVTVFKTRLTGLLQVVTRPVFQFSNWTLDIMTMLANGNVGIGTTTPTEKLEVSGKTKTTTFQMTTTPTAGYVLTSDASGNGTWSAAAGGLTYFTEAQNTAAPNATVPVDSLTAISATTNADFAIVPKGNGAILAAIPNNAAGGGNKRGTNAVDLQTSRSSAEKVASGQNAVISGGENNTASGPLATVGGGTTNISSNFRTTVSGGISNTASGIHATVGGGYNNVSSGEASFTVGQGNTASNTNSTAIGQANTASGNSSVAIGLSNTANAQSSIALGTSASTLGVIGRLSHASGQEATAGDSQTSKFILRERTTDNTATTITTNSSTASTNNQVILSNQSAYRFKGTIIGKQSGSTNVAAWDVDGIIVRGANAASTTLSLGNVTLVQNTPAWGTPTLAADTTNGGLRVQVTGAAATNIQWTAVIDTTEVIYA